MSASAFRATYSDWRLVKTRRVVQVVMEVPLEDADKAYEILGGMPNPSEGQWFGIAALQSAVKAQPERKDGASTARAKLPWREKPVSSQVAIRVTEPSFKAFLQERYPDEWHETSDPEECIKLMLGVTRKRDIQFNHRALVLWKQVDDQYQVWGLKERVGA